ncbi:MAG TPA: hypothetical protein VD866_24390 [Urbifossiella sp.]|nr:hypothetical protein [Urbifossiella sp.]
MPRFAPALVVLALAGPASAQPTGAINPQVVTARVEDGSLVWTTTQLLPVAKQVVVTVVVGGRPVTETRNVTELTRVTSERSEAVKNVKATDGAGKAVTPDRLAERLREDAVVVLHVGRLPDGFRRAFRDDTILIELPGPTAPPRQ